MPAPVSTGAPFGACHIGLRHGIQKRGATGQPQHKPTVHDLQGADIEQAARTRLDLMQAAGSWSISRYYFGLLPEAWAHLPYDLQVAHGASIQPRAAALALRREHRRIGVLQIASSAVQGCVLHRSSAARHARSADESITRLYAPEQAPVARSTASIASRVPEPSVRDLPILPRARCNGTHGTCTHRDPMKADVYLPYSGAASAAAEGG